MSIDTDYISIAAFPVKVNGQKIDEALQNLIIELVVDSNRHLPDMASIQFYAHDPTSIDDGTFTVGHSLEIAVAGESGEQTLFKGEITAITPEFTDQGYIIITIRGYDKSHRLYRGKKTRAFMNMTDSAIVQQVVQEAGLQATVDSTSATHQHVWQNNQVDIEFIQERAARVGYVVYMEKEKLCFKKKQPAPGGPIELEWGQNLRTFRPQIAGTQLVDKVKVKSWDPEKKEAVEGETQKASSTSNQGGETQDGGAVAKKVFGGTRESAVVTYPGLDAGQAKTMAQSLYDRIHSRFVQAEGTCIGNPQIKSGTLVKITEVGSKFSGTYEVTSAVHTFSTEQGYETTFHVRGAQSDVLTYLLEGQQDPDAKRALLHGVVPGLVTNIEDEKGLGRVKVKFPWLDGELESEWARLSSLGAGKKRGIYYIPEVDDEVLVAFEYGDINRPYILGGLWNGQDEAPKKSTEIVEQGKVNERVIESRTGHVIILNDKEGEEQIIIRDKTEKNEIIISSPENSLSINMEKDATLVAKGKVSSTSDGTTDIVSKGAMTLKADQGSDITMEGTNITIKGKANIKVEATANLELKATGEVKMQGAKVSIQGNSMTEVKSGGILQIQGSLVKIN